MIIGVGGKEEVVEKFFDIIKVFIVVMMIVGVGVIGICYVLLNDFIFGSCFSQFLDVVKLFDCYYIIICGLGGVSMVIIEELIYQGYEIVVIEKDIDNCFLYMVCFLGVFVIVEDVCLERMLVCVNIN